MAIKKRNNVKNLYFNDRLREKFETFSQYPCTIVEAPMGYGKTTFVNEVLKEIDGEVIWQSVYDRTFGEFWSGFCDAFYKIDKKVAAGLEKLGPPIDLLTKREIMRVLETLDIKNNVFLIIDDYHYVKLQEVDEFLEVFIRNMPEKLHLVLMTRTAIFKNTRELVLKGIINHIGIEDLRFSPRDIKKYYKLCGIVISDEEQVKIYSQSEGWISALYLLILDYKINGEFILTYNIQDLIYETVYEPLELELKAFLKRICLFDAFTLEEAQYMWGRKDTLVLLKRLMECNAFITRDNRNGRYNLHNIFTMCIRKEFQMQDEAEKRDIWNRMGDLYYNNKKYLYAMEGYYNAKNFEGVFSSLEMDRSQSIFTEQKDNILKYYRECPIDVKKRYPGAILVFSISMITYFHDLELHKKACEEFLYCLDNNDTLSLDERNQLLGEYEMSRSFLYFNDFFKMKENFIKARKLLNHPSKSMDINNCFTFSSPSILYLYYRETGKVKNLVEIMNKDVKYHTVNTDGHGIGFNHIMEGEYYYFIGDFENAEIEVIKAIPLAKDKKQMDIILCAYFLLSKIAIVRGDFLKAKQLLEKVEKEIKEKLCRTLRYTIEFCKLYIFSCLKENKSIPEWMYNEEYRKNITFPGISFGDVIYGRLLIEKGENIKFLGLLDEFIKQASIFPNLLSILYLNIYIAIASYRLIRTKDAFLYLRKALDIAVEDELYMAFVENYDELKELLNDIELEREYSSFIKKVRELSHIYTNSIKQIINENFIVEKEILTCREKEICLLVIEGLNNKEIGEILYISTNTVKAELKNIFVKLGINSRVLLTKEMVE